MESGKQMLTLLRPRISTIICLVIIGILLWVMLIMGTHNLVAFVRQGVFANNLDAVEVIKEGKLSGYYFHQAREYYYYVNVDTADAAKILSNAKAKIINRSWEIDSKLEYLNKLPLNLPVSYSKNDDIAIYTNEASYPICAEHCSVSWLEDRERSRLLVYVNGY